MKIKKLSIIILTIILFIGILPVSAENNDKQDEPGGGAKVALYSNNIFAPMRVYQEMKFRKVIKLDGYKGKDISGILNFELVPDNKANLLYGDKNDTHVRILPGISKYSYQVPFSSDDYVDDEYNKLAWYVINYERTNKHPAYNDEGIKRELQSKFIDHALLHEWGRLDSGDHSVQIRVGKLLPEQFNNQGGKEEYEKQAKMIEDYAKEGKKISWEKDPDTEDIIGWKTGKDHILDKSKIRAYDFLGSYNTNSENLLDYGSFCDGSMSITDIFNLKAKENEACAYYLETLTRPIALSKEYDSKGNIISIVKPLMPADNAFELANMHEDYEKIENIREKYTEEDEGYFGMIFRYKLKENKAEGVNLNISDKELIVDVWEYGNYILMFENEEEADKYYEQALYDEDINGKWFAGINSSNYKLKYANDIDLVNKIVNTEEPKDKTPNNNKKIDSPKTGDHSQPLVLTSAIILAVILITLLLIINKRRNK